VKAVREPMELSDTQRVLSFESFFAATEKGLRYALVALFGAEDGRAASAHALLYSAPVDLPGSTCGTSCSATVRVRPRGTLPTHTRERNFRSEPGADISPIMCDLSGTGSATKRRLKGAHSDA
jgi:hypothetical protein